MNLTKRLLTFVLLLPLVAAAQSITPAQIEQFKSLPKAQQEALARQYGVDLNALTGGNAASSRPQPVQVVEPVNQITDQERDKALAEQAEEQKTADSAHATA